MAYLHRDPTPDDYKPKGGIEDVRQDKRRNTRPTGPKGGIEDVTRTKKSTNEESESAKEYKLVVAAIDFGTTYSGYAYSFRDELGADFSRVTCKTWKSNRSKASTISQKTPTSVLLNQAGEFVAFGFEAEEKYEELANDNLHGDFRFFRRFKMKLHNNAGLTRESTLVDDQGNEMRAIDVFAHAIRYMKEHLTESLRKTKYEIREKEIAWVITIPAIWDPKSKQFMREAAEQGGILDNQLQFALEPEAASVYLKEVPVERTQTVTKEAALRAFPPGTKYLVLDLGGGTIDITARMVVDDRTLRELHHATGNNHGGNSINDQIFNYLEKLLGSNVMCEFKNNTDYTSAYLDLDMEIETKKRAVQNELEKQKFMSLTIPAQLLELFEDKNDMDLETHLKLKNERNVTLKSGKLRLDFVLVSKFFRTSLDAIIGDTQRVLQHKDCQDITKIMLVGGFAESKIVSTAIKKAFEHIANIKVVIPPEPGLAVLKGAVIYRHWPEVVSYRKCPHTYGSRLMRYFLKDFDDQSKLKMVRGQPVCLDVFGKFVTIDTEFETNQTCDSLEVFPLRPDDTEMTVFIYKTDAEDARYVTDDGCTYLGKIKVDMPDTTGGLDRKVILTLTLGQTEIVVKGKHWPNGTEATVEFDWLS
ncbi:hypothetical protein FSP39_004047 [Pinctada imbricata]|uniref:Uncharacterized protein n=1 Tax=Pinctada imbricata TaxID=66713 RepID=A0AA88Y6K2_PINIB|nr:hypothetical protein FSP39_004047 [Pinctada imbricata]